MVKFYKVSFERQDKQFYCEVLMNKGGAGAPVAHPLAMPLGYSTAAWADLMLSFLSLCQLDTSSCLAPVGHHTSNSRKHWPCGVAVICTHLWSQFNSYGVSVGLRFAYCDMDWCNYSIMYLCKRFGKGSGYMGLAPYRASATLNWLLRHLLQVCVQGLHIK